jgi:G6PDH family F420-dependent oxidoreductase
MLSEAVEIIRRLWAGGYVNFDGRHFQVDSAKLWDLPDQPLKLGIAASGQQSCRLAGQKADFLIAVEPSAATVAAFDAAGGTGKPRVGQLPISFDRSRDAAIERALELFGWFGGGWKVNAELPGTAAFAAASSYVRADDIAESIPCGDSVDAVVTAVKGFADAGFTHVALCQIGGDSQADFIEWWQRDLGPALGA